MTIFDDEGDDARRYDTAQICLNGHIINRMADDHPEANADHCDNCGQKTIMKCQSCGTNIRGYKHIPRLAYMDDSPAPKFCFKCGKPFPWTVSSIQAAKALADETTELTEADKIILKASIDDIIADTPMTAVGIVRFKKYAAKAGKVVADGMKDILVNIVSEAARKGIWGQ